MNGNEMGRQTDINQYAESDLGVHLNLSVTVDYGFRSYKTEDIFV